IGPSAVEVEGEEPAAAFDRPVVAQIDHHADMGVAAAEVVRDSIARLLPAFGDIEMPMVSMLIDEGIRARIRIECVRTDEMCAGEVVPEMAIDGVDKEQFAVLIPIVAPRIGGAGADRLDDLSHRMIPPNRAAQG